MNTVNEAALALVKRWEGLRLTAYADPEKDGTLWTIGWGHTSLAGPPMVGPGLTITRAEAERILRDDLDRVASSVRQLVTVPLTDNQFGALVSFTFNIGRGAFEESTLLRKLNDKDYGGASQQFARWNKDDGKTVRGLTLRRADETALFRTPDAPPGAADATPTPPPVGGASAPIPPPARKPGFWASLWAWFLSLFGR